MSRPNLSDDARRGTRHDRGGGQPTTLTPAVLRNWRLPVPEGGKAQRGSVLVIGGSRATPGAVLLAGTAALRAGAGVLQLAVAESTAAALSIAVPEARVVGLPETGSGSVSGRGSVAALAGMVAGATTILIGPGLDDIDETAALLRGVCGEAEHSTLVLDAYALGALSRDPELTATRDRPAVLTPNTTEAAILLDGPPGEGDAGPGEVDDDLDQVAVRITRKYGAVTSLHGHVAAPGGGLWCDGGGHAGLGTSGSGDVLAGIVAGLLARGAQPDQAACWAAHVHATAGQRLVPRHGRLGLLARELVDQIAATISELQS